jgi:hypothetical protein
MVPPKFISIFYKKLFQALCLLQVWSQYSKETLPLYTVLYDLSEGKGINELSNTHHYIWMKLHPFQAKNHNLNMIYQSITKLDNSQELSLSDRKPTEYL